MRKISYFAILAICTLITFAFTCLRIYIYNSEIVAEQKALSKGAIRFKLYSMGEPPDLIVFILLLATFTGSFYFVKKISYSILFTLSVLLFMFLNSHFWIETITFFDHLDVLTFYQQETVQSKLLVTILELSFIFPLALIQTSLLSHFIKKRHHAKISLK